MPPMPYYATLHYTVAVAGLLEHFRTSCDAAVAGDFTGEYKKTIGA